MDEILSYNKVLVFNLGFDRANSKIGYHWVYIPDRKYNFYRIGFYNNILGTDRLSMYIEIGFNRDARIDVLREKDTVLNNLRDIGIINEHKLVASHEVIMDPAYVHISKSSELLKDSYFKMFRQNNVYFAGRYGQWTYCSMEDCFNQAKKIAALISKNWN